MKTISNFLWLSDCYGVDRKPSVTKYWSRNPIISTPFFRKYMGRINFECILSNIHVSDNTIASTEPLVKLKPFLDMCDRNFLHVYKSNKNIVWMRQDVSGKDILATKCKTQESHPNFTFNCIKFVKQIQVMSLLVKCTLAK